MKSFASDNNSGIHPSILQAINSANQEHAISYGDDSYTQKLQQHFSELFGKEVDMYLVFNGTGANIVSLQSATSSYNNVICAATGHVYVDECGAFEKFSGSKLTPITTHDGKLTPTLIKPHLHGFGDEHHTQPKVIYITQSTELGTVYSVKEIKELADFAHSYNMYLHVDGARIANAVAHLNTDLKTLITDTGVDILSFGGTKNGLMIGEAVIFLNRELAKPAKYFRKQSTQLYSKMRFIAAQFLEYLNNDLWLKNADHSNQMTQLLLENIKDIPEITITQQVQSNSIFAKIPSKMTEILLQKHFFYVWDANTNEIRWMCSFDTTEEDIKAFAEDIKKVILHN